MIYPIRCKICLTSGTLAISGNSCNVIPDQCFCRHRLMLSDHFSYVFANTHWGFRLGNFHTVTVRHLLVCSILSSVQMVENIVFVLAPAKPTVLLPEYVDVTEGEERTLQCDISGFYPKKLAVTWHIQNGSHTIHAGVSHHSRVCTELAVHNPDGTYSLRSSITLHSNIVTNTHILIICQVEHQTFSHLFNKSATLTVRGGFLSIHFNALKDWMEDVILEFWPSLFCTAPPQPLYRADTLIAVTSLTSLLLVTSFIGGAVLISRYCCKGMCKLKQTSCYFC